MNNGKTVSDVFNNFLRSNDKKIADGADRNIRVEQLKNQEKQQEQAAAMDRFNAAFKVTKTEEAGKAAQAGLVREDQIRAENRENKLQDMDRVRSYSVSDREDNQQFKMDIHDKDLEAIRIKEEAAANKAPTLKTLGEGGLDNLSGALSTITNSFGDMKKSASKITKATGPVSGLLKSNNPYSKDAQVLKNQLDIARQKIGKLLEGGKLVGADEDKYKRMMPSLEDTPAVFMAKMANIEKELRADITINLEAKGAAGYDTGALTSVVDKYLTKADNMSGSELKTEYTKVTSTIKDIEKQIAELEGKK